MGNSKAADAKHSVRHDLFGPSTTIGAFSNEISAAIAELKQLMQQHEQALPAPFLAAASRLLNADLLPCLRYLSDAVGQLDGRIEAFSVRYEERMSTVDTREPAASEAATSIVIVDDDELCLEVMRRLLRSLDCTVHSFSDERAALEYLTNPQTSTQVLIVDHRMPGLSGLELLQRVQHSRSRLPPRAFLCSGAALPEDTLLAAEEINVSVLSKDIFRDKEDFLNLIAHH